MKRRGLAILIIVLVGFASIAAFAFLGSPKLPESFDNPSYHSSIRFAQNAIAGGALNSALFSQNDWIFKFQFDDADGSALLA